MFKRRSRAVVSSVSEAVSVAAAKAKVEANLTARLQELAAELDASDRLITIIQSAGDGVTSEELHAQQHQVAAVQPEADDMESEHGGALSPPRPSPSPDPETWIPRKRTREEDEAFDSFFSGRPLPPTPPRPKGKTRVCKLGKDAMQVID
jgi:hypothetical protein